MKSLRRLIAPLGNSAGGGARSVLHPLASRHARRPRWWRCVVNSFQPVYFMGRCSHQ